MTPVRTEVAIIGAGISGIGAAIRLDRDGEHDYVVLEKAESLGGTWRDNTYPGCACDVPSALYSYSFAQTAEWTRVFAAQPEILAYVRRTAERHGIVDRIRFGEPVETAEWDERLGVWVVRTTKTTYHARFLVSCAGYLHEPKIPDVPGLDRFEGTLFHSSRWDHGHRLDGERVAVIGTGASAIQFVPRIAERTRSLHLFQRTPQWILPKPDAAMPERLRSAIGILGVEDPIRRSMYLGLEALGVGFRRPALLERAEVVARAHLRRQLPDPELRAKLTPDYVLGCNRVLLSNDYYPALRRPNVHVHATGVREIRGRVVVGTNGERAEVDTLVLGTGFHVSDPPIAERIRGRDRRTLAEHWSGSPRAHRGTTVAGFPNAFVILGPNLAIGHNSAFVVIEAQLDYVLATLRAMRARGAVRVEVRPEALDAYNATVQRDLQHTVWNTGGCSSYYIDANGRNSIGFPWGSDTMRGLLVDFDHENYVVGDTSGVVEQASIDP